MSDPKVGDGKFDTIICVGGKQDVDKWFWGKNQWRWVRVDPSKIDGIKFIALYERLMDPENNYAVTGRGEVVGYAAVLNYEVCASGPEEGKYGFVLGEIQPLAIPSGKLHFRHLGYVRLQDLLAATTLEDLFPPSIIDPKLDPDC